ncbi:phenolic glucoside malonyltransferase 1-like [Arachis stenosperma]|uniref:phenolic glucoside malonyltransferase 1-like n=1 Tax=Arachis stenosperma TaxID=217475 RepID=UPI0025AD2277|nr:phenolic glucoside malonyltransferase 1-like [Arachis stenosperma]
MAQSPPAFFKVHEVYKVAPPQGTTTTTTTTLPLTFFDLLWLRLPSTERLYFYEFPNPTSSFFDSLLPNLKHSLQLTLQHFFPLAGNITWPQHSLIPTITYVPGQDSVPLVVSESNEDFNHLCSNLCQVSKFQQLVPRLSISDHRASLLALQVTVFPNSGFCIGITTHHAAFDGNCSTMFMKAWAYTCSQISHTPSMSLPENLTPFFDRSAVKDPKRIAELFAKTWLNFGGENNRSLKILETATESRTDVVKGVFELKTSQIQKLKKHAKSSNLETKVSTFAVTSAYLLHCLVKAEQAESKKVAFLFNVDCRSRLEPPLGPTYFGNCVAIPLISVEKERIEGSDGFINALKMITEVLYDLENNDNGVLNGAENYMLMVQSVVGEGSRLYSPSGSPWFGVYGVDFGFGKPTRVDVASVNKTASFSLSEGRNVDGGIEIGLALTQNHMETFAALFHQQIETF